MGFALHSKPQRYRQHRFAPRHGRALKVTRASTSGNGTGPSIRTTTWRQRWQQWWDVVPSNDGDGSIFKALSQVWALTKDFEHYLFLGLVSLIAAAVCELAVPHFVSRVFHAVITACASPATLDLTGVSFSPAGILHLVRAFPALEAALAGVLLCGVLETTFAALRGASASMVTIQVVRKLRAMAFRKCLAQEMLWFGAAGNSAAALASRLSSDCLAVSRMIAVNLNVALRNALQAVGGLCYLVLLNRHLAIVCFATALLMCTISFRYGMFSRRASRASQAMLADVTSTAEESFRNVSLVQAHGYERREAVRFGGRLQALVDISYRITAAYAAYLFSYISVWHTGSLALLAWGAAFAVGGHITPAELTAFVMFSDHVITACIAVCEQWANMLENVGSVDMILRILDRGDRGQLAPGVLPLPSLWQAGIHLHGVTFAYPARKSGHPALADVTLAFEPGQVTALVGRSGSGKSTLVQLLTRVIEPDTGAVCLGDVRLSDIDLAWYRDGIAIVPQEPHLFTASVAENIAYGLEGVSREQIERAAREANAHDFICALPLGYETEVTDGSLSGGQRQRMAIARALLRQPKLLLLDECTSALDAATEAAVQQTFDSIMATRTRSIVIIAHRLATVRRCDKIVVMDRGRVAEVGSHETLMASGPAGIYRSLVQQSAGPISIETEDEGEDAGEGAGGGGDFSPEMSGQWPTRDGPRMDKGAR